MMVSNFLFSFLASLREFNKSLFDKTIVRLFKRCSILSKSSFGEINKLSAISTNCSSASI